jgi:hypothetical protein
MLFSVLFGLLNTEQFSAVLHPRKQTLAIEPGSRVIFLMKWRRKNAKDVKPLWHGTIYSIVFLV